LREQNVINPAHFVSKIREAYLKLLAGTGRISVSLPDTIGRVFVLDLETRFKTRAEGADMVRWKLKKSFPFDINEMHLDYQVLQERDSGEVSTLVSLISRRPSLWTIAIRPMAWLRAISRPISAIIFTAIGS
jgi:type IV pilus assembly protein PilM